VSEEKQVETLVSILAKQALINALGMSDDQKRQLQDVVVQPEELAQPSLVYTHTGNLVTSRNGQGVSQRVRAWHGRNS
jgi:uncharacterized membrane protein affecting hemolysin expression